MPTGFALGNGGVYLGEGTDLVHLADTDGDERADRRRILFSGFGTDDTHQNINSFTWSPDGELLFCQGMHAYSRVETAWGIRRADDSAVWRFNPRNLTLQPYLSPKISCDNPWGINFGRWGEMFLKGYDYQVYDASPAMIPTTHLFRMQDGYGLLGQTASKSMAVEFVETSHLPPDMQDCLLIAGYKDQSIERLSLVNEGSGIKGHRLPKLVTSQHRSFRPVDIRIGPDGAIYVADWYNAIIGHYQASFRNPARDQLHGRIWRITANGRPLVKPPRLVDIPDAELVDQMRHEERWVRYQAKRLLADLPTDRAMAALNQWLEELQPDDPAYEHHLYEALGIAASHGVVDEELLGQLLRAREPYGRAFATRMVGRWHSRLPNALKLLRQQIVDSHPRVRMEAIVAASHLRSPRAIEVAVLAMNRPLDRPLEFALTQTVHALAPQWLPALARGDELFAGRTDHAAFVYGQVASEPTARALRSMVESTVDDQPNRIGLPKQLVHVGDADDLTLALQESVESPELIHELRIASSTRPMAPSGNMAEPIRQHLGTTLASVRISALSIARRWKVRGLEALIDVHRNPRKPTGSLLPVPNPTQTT